VCLDGSSDQSSQVSTDKLVNLSILKEVIESSLGAVKDVLSNPVALIPWCWTRGGKRFICWTRL